MMRSTLRRLLLAATLSWVAVAAPGAASASTPNPNPSDTSTTEAVPTDTHGVTNPNILDNGEAVESWALSPASSTTAGQAGGRTELSYQADPGSVLNDEVTLYNLGNVALTFRVYATDAFNNAQSGQFDLLPGDTTPSDVGAWVKLPLESITLEPMKQATFPITVTIPADAAPGDHAGAILASSPISGTTEEGAKVTMDRRTGTRLYLRVNGPLSAEFSVDSVDTEYSHSINPLGGSASVRYRVRNTGNVRLSGTTTIKLAGPLGIGETSKTLPALTDLLPGQSVVLTAALDDVPALFAGRTTVIVTPDEGSGAKPASGAVTSFTPPLTPLIVLLVAICILLVLRARRRRTTPGGASDDGQPDAGHAPTPLVDPGLAEEPEHASA